MLTPHAILIARPNFSEIIQETYADPEALDSLLEDSLAEEMPYYLVLGRNDSNGFLIWMAYSKEELETEFQIIVKDQFDSHFAKIPA